MTDYLENKNEEKPIVPHTSFRFKINVFKTKDLIWLEFEKIRYKNELKIFRLEAEINKIFESWNGQSSISEQLENLNNDIYDLEQEIDSALNLIRRRIKQMDEKHIPTNSGNKLVEVKVFWVENENLCEVGTAKINPFYIRGTSKNIEVVIYNGNIIKKSHKKTNRKLGAAAKQVFGRKQRNQVINIGTVKFYDGFNNYSTKVPTFIVKDSEDKTSIFINTLNKMETPQKVQRSKNL